MDNQQSTKSCSRQSLLLESLIDFFKVTDALDIMLPIVRQETAISLRILDWLVTNHSKSNSIVYSNGDETFNMYKSYKDQLKGYSKKQFDPFCRRQRVLINYIKWDWEDFNGEEFDENSKFLTTVGQLNFFRWAITNKVIQYAVDNVTSIEEDMISSAKLPNNNKKRRELSSSNTKGMAKHSIEIRLRFL